MPPLMPTRAERTWSTALTRRSPSASARAAESPTQIGRDGVEPTRVHQPGASPLRPLVAGFDTPPHEQRLPRQIGVVGAGRGARLEEEPSVLRVRPRGRGHHTRSAGQAGHRLGVGQIEDHLRPVARRFGQTGPEPRQPFGRPAGQRDSCPRRRRPGQVLRGQAAHESRSPDQNQMELAWPVPHAHMLSGALSTPTPTPARERTLEAWSYCRSRSPAAGRVASTRI